MKAWLAGLMLVPVMQVPVILVADPLRIGASPTYPPYLSLDPAGERVGMDATLLAEICARGGFECEWVDIDVAGLIPALVAGDVDVVTGGIGYSVPRDAVIDFTCPYHITENAYGTLHALRPDVDLETATIAVTRDTLHQLSMEQAGFRTLVAEGNQAAVQAVLEGRADAYFGSIGVVEAHPRGSELFEIGTHPIPTTGAALGVAETRPDLRDRLDALLAEISADGTLERMTTEWLFTAQGDVIADCNKPNLLS